MQTMPTRCSARCLLIAALFVLFISAQLSANQDTALHTNPTWLKLLHAIPSGNGYRADIINQDFYLTPREPLSPANELAATIEAFSQNNPQAIEMRCRFPARFDWLSKQMQNRFDHLNKASCPNFEAWSDLQNIDSISLLQVSGYLGNPASAFGHLLLRVDKKDSTGQRGLQDLGVNFGAKIPDGEGTFKYIAKGLTGGYTAGFTNKEFYSQDQVYAATEFRDMWAYQLNLSDEQLNLLVYHLWELTNARFQYFFLRKNCAYHLAELLELVLDESFNLKMQPWYLPVSLFHQLTALDKKSAEQGGKKIINNVSFIPSLQREAYAEFEALSSEESLVANTIIKDQSYNAVPNNTSVAVLNFILSFTDYKKVGANNAEQQQLKELRQATLAKRFLLPGASAQDAVQVTSIDAPATGPKTRKLRLSHVSQDGAAGLSDSVGELQLALFAYDVLNSNKASLKDSQFKLGQLTALITEDELQLQQLDFIRIEKLAPPSSNISGESKSSWKTAVGLLANAPGCDECNELFVEGGIGRSKQITPSVLAYGFVEGRVAHTQGRAGVSVGAYYRLNPKLRFNWQSSWFAKRAGEQVDEHRLEGLYSITKNTDFNLSIEDNGVATRSSAGLVLRW